jgi:mono/diheme cytochrome c family protein
MKSKLSIGLLVAALSLVSSLSTWGQDGSALYKSKCSHCHGANGEGKKAPALKGKSADDIVALLTKGDPQKKAPHSKGMSGIDAPKVKAIADFIQTLK